MKDYTDYFSIGVRKNGDEFILVSETENGIKIKDLVRSIHFDGFFDSGPCDWIYEQIYYAFDRLQECDCDASYWGAVNEIQPDIYANDLLDWAKNGYAREYIDDNMHENEKGDCIIEIIQGGQRRAIERIYHKVWEFLQKNEET